MRLFVVLLLLATGCPSGVDGAPCTRHSDCHSGYCSTDGTCAIAVDAAVDAPDDASEIPPLDGAEDDAPIDAPSDAEDIDAF